MWGIQLISKGEIPLSRQIFLAFQSQILSGYLKEGQNLPSTRALAKDLGVSRNTVCEAYDMLWTEGYIVTKAGAPTRVAGGIRMEPKSLTNIKKPIAEPVRYRWDFKTGRPDLTAFPRAAWAQAVRGAAESLKDDDLAYGSPKGHAPLCEEIAQWLYRNRGMAVDPEDLFITSGSTQALHLLIGLLHREGLPFAVEDPSHPGIRTILCDRGFSAISMLADENGADVSVVEGKSLSAAYVTPSHQFPLGGILPAYRRAELIRMARQQSFYVIEDDYDSEFRYGGAPVSSLYSMDASAVIYVGTFSKTLFPALRIGFVILPAQLHKAWMHHRNYSDVQNPVLEQAALAEFLRSRKMDRHVRGMCRLYGEKRELLISELAAAFGGSIQPWGDISGLHIALRFEGLSFDEPFLRACAAKGIRVYALYEYGFDSTSHRDKLLLGYGHLRTEEIRGGVRALREAVDDFFNKKDA